MVTRTKKKTASKKKTSKKFNKPWLKFLNKTHTAVRSHLSATTDLPTFLDSVGSLSLNGRRRLVEQALVLLKENYVHLPLKVSMHGVNPIQRLQLIKYRLEKTTSATMGSEHAFHSEILEIFNSVRDLHTNYLLPAPFDEVVAFLPFDIEEYFEDNKPHYIASHFVPGFTHQHFKHGVEIKMWNGVPIKREIEVNANRHAGSNLAARHVRGIERLTKRPLIISLPPNELWVDIGYIDLKGEEHEMRQEWLVTPLLPDADGVDADTISTNATCLGLDLEVDIIGRMKKMLFAPKVVAKEQKKQKITKRKASAGQTVPTSMLGVFTAKSVETSSGVFGYIRMRTFNVKKPHAFIDEFIRLAKLLPQNGLIIDVRGNGGGHIWASEGLLQVLTPSKIQTEPTQFINTPLNLKICKKHENDPLKIGVKLKPWIESIDNSIQTGAIYSHGVPITPVEFANDWGQKYHGSVVLITDAKCYSATDIFAAGFQDHKIGHIIGVDDNTGAGGANVWGHDLLQGLLHYPEPADETSPYKNLPNGSGMRVSIRRTLRVGEQSGTPLEDLGVRPDERYFMTKNDLLNSNEDLINQAAERLSEKPVRKLDATTEIDGASLKVNAETLGLSRLDIYIDNRPIKSVDINDGTQELELSLPTDASSVRLEGFTDHKLVAARKLNI